MNGYFRPLRRKVGVLALLLTCTLTACWIRSLSCDDCIDCWLTSRSTLHVISGSSSLNIAYAWDDGTEPSVSQVNGACLPEALMNCAERVDWKTFPADDAPTDYFAWDWNLCGLSIAANDYGPIHKRAVRIVDVYFIVPLTLLSAWLLLSKPRSKPAATQSTVSTTPANAWKLGRCDRCALFDNRMDGCSESWCWNLSVASNRLDVHILSARLANRHDAGIPLLFPNVSFFFRRRDHDHRPAIGH